MSNAPSYDVPALRKAVAVLNLMADSEEPLGVSELARLADIPKNMAFRLLVTLEDMGWVYPVDEKPRYQLTLKPFRLFARPISRHGLTAACHAPLRWLHEQCRESVYVGVLHDLQALNVQVIDGSSRIRVAAEVGSTFDLHCTAHGKVLLAHASAELRETCLANPLKSYTGRTITDPATLRRHLDEVVRQGYAINDEEFGRGMIGLAAPVFDAEGTVRAAIGVFTATINIPIERLTNEIAPLVIKAADWASLNGAPGYRTAKPNSPQ